jgi:ATP-dependent helicase/nuclease subunit B
MALRLWIGGAGAGKSHKLFQYIIDESQKNTATNYIVIVPEQFTLQTQRDLVMKHPRKGIMNIDVLSFARLAYRVFDEVGGEANRRLLMDDMGKSLILRRIASAHEKELRVLGKNLKKIGYINEVKSIISEFMQYDISEGDINSLMEQTDSRPMLQYKLQDLGLLYHAFKENLQEKYTTKEELLVLLCDVINDSKMIQNSVIVFDGFTGFTPVQNKLITKLLEKAIDIHVTVLLRDEDEEYTTVGINNKEQDTFYLSYKTISALTKMAEDTGAGEITPVIIKGSPVYRFRNNKAMSYLEKNLFQYDATPYEEIQESIHIFASQTPQEEMKRVCAEISRLIRAQSMIPDTIGHERGLRYADIAIITGDIETYAFAAGNELTNYNIPYFIDQTRGILLNPFIEYIRALVEIMTKDYNYEGMFRYLKSSLSGYEQREIDEIENYVLACGIRGRKQWNQKWIRKYKGLTTEELEKLEAVRERISAGLSKFEAGIRALETAGEYTKILYELLIDNRIEQKLHVMAQAFEKKGEAAFAKEYSQIYRLVMELLDRIAELLSDEKMSIGEYGELLDAGFDEIRVGIIPPSLDEVIVGDITRTRLKDIKVLFFVGVNDTIIPKANATTGILSDLDREYLQEVELAPSSRQQAYMQRLYLYMIMTKPTERLYLSYSQVSAAGKSLRPSYLIQTVQKLFSKLQVEKNDVSFSEIQITDLFSPEASLEAMVRGIYGPYSEAYCALYQWYTNQPDYSGQLLSYKEEAFRTHRTDKISKAVASVLYGKKLENSVTRLEMYAACAYSHFLHYGLQLQEREMYSFEASDMGSIFHEVLAEYSQMLSHSQYTWFDIPTMATEELVEKAVEACMNRNSNEILYSTSRYMYAINRIKRIMSRTVNVLSSQVRKGVFVPGRFEFAFSGETDYKSLHFKLSEEEEMHLRGRIDRMDVCVEQDSVYVKIIDYKSGNQNFDLAAVYHGLQLQLVVYLDAAMEMQQKENPDKEIIPAGILYYHIEDPIIDRKGEMTPEEISQKIIAELSMKGLVNSDENVIRMMDREFEKSSDVIPVSKVASGEFSKNASIASTAQFKTISDYVNQKITAMGHEIVDGVIAVNPYESEKADACKYCSYHSVCGFDEKISGFNKRRIVKQEQEEVLSMMEESKA